MLQKSDAVPIWGTAAPGEAVALTLDKATASATAGNDGKWVAKLNLQAEGEGPFNLIVQGKNRISVSDVLIGEVWVCGGQSNMEFPLAKAANAQEAIASSSNQLLRQFQVKEKASATPLDSDSIQGKWVVAAPKTCSSFTAVGYFFGREVQKALNVPVGLLNDSWGGTVVEAWISAEGFNPAPELKAEAQKADDDRKAFDAYGAQYAAWQKQYNREDHPGSDPQAFAAPKIDTSDWKPVTLPGLLSTAGLPDAGAIWIRKTVTVPPEMAGRNFDIRLGDIRDYDKVYWDGRNIGSSDVSAVIHRYGMTSSLHVPAGDHVLAVRIFNPGTGAGIDRDDPRMSINSIKLDGQWLAKVEFALPPLDDAAKGTLPHRTAVPIDSQNVASYDFNGMINPIIPYGMRGIIWYQGEGNAMRGYQYRTAFPLLIKDWRSRWGQGDFPFYFCQVASYNGIPGKVVTPAWYPDVREAQTMTLSLPNTGQAILIDIGEEANIHPSDKLDVGDRLARIALANTYGRKDIVFSGPVYDSMKVEDNKLRLHFLHTEGGLKAKPLPETYQPSFGDPKTVPLVRTSPGSELEGFAICGDDHKWQWADAKIDGDDVLVSSPDVPKPSAVRYAWCNYPYCNLYNGAGLPAGPFRTDNLPLLSQKLHY